MSSEANRLATNLFASELISAARLAALRPRPRYEETIADIIRPPHVSPKPSRATIMIGKTIGPYQVVALLGEGGMGQVYRARDAKLNRDVALKVLPGLLADDPDRLARFQREAQVLGALNHPNIAHIHGFEDSSDAHAIVMELVEGPTLAEMIGALEPRGIPLTDALPIARQIAEALEAAHELGIVHRDLKPANIKVRDDGVVKVLDFGLAKAMDTGATASSSAMNSPTLTARATQIGTILGTAAYMAPEQAKGRSVDRRADIWAFGVVLYEMLTAERCFKGEDISDTLAAVLRQDVDWAALPVGTPTRLRRLLERCLDRDVKQRLRDIGEARVEIAKIEAGAPDTSVILPASALSAPVPASRATVPWAVAGAAIIALGAVLGLWAPWTSTPPAQPMHLAIVPPAALGYGQSNLERSLAISPDGMRVAYISAPDGKLVVRPIDSLEAEPLPGITGARQPFFSHDGKWIGFSQGATELKKVSVTGGPAVSVAKLTAPPRGASWGADDTIVFATAGSALGLLSVPAGGGQEPKELTKPDSGVGDHLFPSLLPGGRAVLFTIVAAAAENSQVAVLDLATGEHKILIRGGSQAEYVGSSNGRGFLVYGVAGTLRAVRFDLKALEVQGDAVPVADRVTMGPNGSAQFATTTDGALIYAPGLYNLEGIRRSLVWLDRNGQETTPINAPVRDYVALRLSPDGTSVALQINSSGTTNADIWVWRLKAETLEKLTLDNAADGAPIWTPDSRRIVFRSNRAGQDFQLFWQAADNTGTVEQLTTEPTNHAATGFAGDNQLLFTEYGKNNSNDLAMMTIDKRVRTSLLARPVEERNATVSPDGRFMAYESSESGDFQVFVTQFPDINGGRWQISTTGGIKPVWSSDSKELFYQRPGPGPGAGELYAVAIETRPTFSRGTPVKLFDLRAILNSPIAYSWDVSRDGKRFIAIKNDEPTAALAASADRPSFVFIVNFAEELRLKLNR